MKKLQYTLLLILPILLSSCNCILGEGDTVSEQREVSGFDRISLSIEARVFPTVSLYAGISGSGSVYYKGEPQVNSNITGSGRVKKRN